MGNVHSVRPSISQPFSLPDDHLQKTLSFLSFFDMAVVVRVSQQFKRVVSTRLTNEKAEVINALTIREIIIKTQRLPRGTKIPWPEPPRSLSPALLAKYNVRRLFTEPDASFDISELSTFEIDTFSLESDKILNQRDFETFLQKIFTECHKLESLKLHHLYCKFLATSFPSTNLKALDIRAGYAKNIPFLQATLQNCVHLKRLVISETKIPNGLFQSFPLNTRLNELSLTGVLISKNDLEDLLGRVCAELTALDLSRLLWKYHQTIDFAAEKLVRLDIRETTMSDVVLKTIFECCLNLKTLSLFRIPSFTGSAFSYLCRPSLSHLTIRGIGINRNALRVLLENINLESLTWLDLDQDSSHVNVLQTFSGQLRLTTLRLTVDLKNFSAFFYFFGNCSHLTSLYVTFLFDLLYEFFPPNQESPLEYLYIKEPRRPDIEKESRLLFKKYKKLNRIDINGKTIMRSAIELEYTKAT